MPLLNKDKSPGNKESTIPYETEKSYEKGKKCSHLLLITFKNLCIINTQRLGGLLMDNMFCSYFYFYFYFYQDPNLKELEVEG